MPTRVSKIKKLAKIICTIGPSCDDEATLTEMILAGMNVARLNFSHGTIKQHEITLKRIRKAEKETHIPIPVMQDLPGPKIRTGKMETGQIELKRDKPIKILKKMVLGTAKEISINTPTILADILEGHRIYLDDGLIELIVKTSSSDCLECSIVAGGILKSNKGINFPDSHLSLPSTTEKDLKDMEWGIKQRIDYFALSFVRNEREIFAIREKLKKDKSSAGIIAKIENREAIENIDSIIDAADGILIARGDMGVELDPTQVPWIQKDLIAKCRLKRKLVITATQMLESMTYQAHPTRAEVTDVTNAIVDGSDCVMLSGETAVGKHPIKVVSMMARIVETAEKRSFKIRRISEELTQEESLEPQFICIRGAALIDAKAALIFDPDGTQSIAITKFDKSKPTIVGVTSIEIARKVSIHHSTIPILIHSLDPISKALSELIKISKERELLLEGDLVAYIEPLRRKADDYVQQAALRLITIS